MVGKEICYGGNETTINAEPDTPNSLSSFHSTKLPFDTKVFASKLLKKFRAFSSPLSPSLRYLSNHRSIPFLSTAPVWLVSSTSFFFFFFKWGTQIKPHNFWHLFRALQIAATGRDISSGDLKVPTVRDQRFSCRLRSEPPDVPEMSLRQNPRKTREWLVRIVWNSYPRSTDKRLTYAEKAIQFCR